MTYHLKLKHAKGLAGHEFAIMAESQMQSPVQLNHHDRSVTEARASVNQLRRELDAIERTLDRIEQLG